MPKTIEVGQLLPSQRYAPGTVQLFLYNAAIWNPHRIHYDLAYARECEDHPALLVDGPLQGDWLTQQVYEWMEEDDELLAFEYSNRRPAYVGDVLQARGKVEGIEHNLILLSLEIINQHEQVTTLGRATVRRPQAD
ncbi:dehydratase [Pseudomonas frederiksbergensis]|jgi:3-methylfumaryl-CoA hydratase|uniref:Dehydratase n=1 Tax=Pseudomonas frederiksbergensis TaxID=104087 RepID=A0A0B1YW20_9PSED|nr:dehydratase [Pseudomonas frederiksbergensis]KHK63059.1 dehydratase [Pseudomonas frederiksbergensis]